MPSLLEDNYHFMKMTTFGELSILVRPTVDPEILNIDIACEHRREAVSMHTNKDETIDQFCTRIRSMLRSLANNEVRSIPAGETTTIKQDKTWNEQKEEMKNVQSNHSPVPEQSAAYTKGIKNVPGSGH